MKGNKLLKLGTFAVATAAAAGSMILADKSIKNLVKGMINSQPTKLRKPVEDNKQNDSESVVREPSTEAQEDVLPNINMNDVVSVIDNANATNTLNKKDEDDKKIEVTSIEDKKDIETSSQISNESPEIETNPLSQNNINASVASQKTTDYKTESPKSEQENPDVKVTMGLPYIAGKLENLEYNEKHKKNNEAQKLDNNEENTKPGEIPDMPFIQKNSMNNTASTNEEPSIKVSGPGAEAEVQLPPQPTISQSEPQVELPGQEASSVNEIKIEDNINPNSIKQGKTKIIGTNIVSNDSNNKLIKIVLKEFPSVKKEKLVAIMAEDGAGLVLEFSNEEHKNENTLVNVYSIKSNGKIILPSEKEKAGAIEFGKTFIINKPELGEFFTK